MSVLHRAMPEIALEIAWCNFAWSRLLPMDRPSVVVRAKRSFASVRIDSRTPIPLFRVPLTSVNKKQP